MLFVVSEFNWESDKEMQDILDFDIPFYDVDSMRVVWHGNYVKYMENGRCSFLAKRGLPYDQMEESGYLFPVINIQVKYIRPCRFGQKVRLITELYPNDNILVFKYTLLDPSTGQKLMKGETRQMAVDKDTGEASFVLPSSMLRKLKGEA